MEVTIIICTLNRARDLEQTLRSLDDIAIPANCSVEVIVADNASKDDTAEVVRAAQPKKFEIRYLYEGRKGKCHVLNSSVAQARGEAILFTDDDVRPPKNWLELMAFPLIKRDCDAVGGGLKLAQELHRPWMTKDYWGGISAYEGPQNEPLQLVGANMGVHRSVFTRVASFDTEIGPGALGFFDDTLFGWQLGQAGFRLRYVPEATVVHHADDSRLLRRHCLSERQKYGASLAYINYHWRHTPVKSPRLRSYYLALKLGLRRFAQPPPRQDVEGLPSWEVSYVAELALCRQYLIECRRPRNYSKLGLMKRPAHNLEETPADLFKPKLST